MRYSNYALVSLLGGALLLLSVGARAQTMEESTRAFEAYGRGQRLLGEKDYAGAQVAFDESYKSMPNPMFLLGLAEAQQQQGKQADAVATLKRYLKERPEAPDRVKIEQNIAAMTSAAAQGTAPSAAKTAAAAGTPAPPAEKPAVAQAAPVFQQARAVARGGLARTTSPMSIIQDIRMSGAYELMKATYEIDGQPIFTRSTDEAPFRRHEQYDLQGATIAPGTHKLSVNLEYRSAGPQMFSYLDRYRYKVRATTEFTTKLGHAVNVTVIGYERGGPIMSPEQRPAVRFTQQHTPVSATQPEDMPLAHSGR